MEACFRLKPGAELFDFDSSLPGRTVLLAVSGKHFQLRGLAAEVASALHRCPCTLPALRQALAEHAPCTPEQLDRVLAGLSSASLIESDSSCPDVHAAPGTRVAARRKTPVIIHWPLLKPAWVARIARPFQWPLNPRLVVVALPALIVLQLYLWSAFIHPIVGSPRALAEAVQSLKPSLFAALFCLNYFGLFFHELGHAAACLRFGIRPGAIGASLYWLLPGFYTDVSQAWRLKRKHRIIVDAGGLYFTLIAASVAGAVFLLARNAAWAVLCATYQLTALMNINPFIRMDGYWILSDALGASNLMDSNRELSQWAVLRWFGAGAPKPKILDLSSGKRKIYWTYYFGFLAFTAYIFFPLCLSYLPGAFHLIVGAAQGIASGWQSHMPLQALKSAWHLTLVALPACGAVFYIYRAVASSIRWAFACQSALVRQ